MRGEDEISVEPFRNARAALPCVGTVVNVTH